MNNYFHSEVFYEPRTCEAKECLGPLAESVLFLKQGFLCSHATVSSRESIHYPVRT